MFADNFIIFTSEPNNFLIMKSSLTLLFFLFIIGLSACGNRDVQVDNWTHFRGSQLNGIALTENAPVTWGEESGIKWKTAIHGRGWSSPVVYADQVWVTTATTDGRELSALCLDFKTGDILYDINVFSLESSIRKHDINSFSSPTPAIEDGYVFVHYGSLGTACINTSNGNVEWTRTDIKCDHVQGPGSSAFLYKNLLILHYEGVDVRFIVALDKKTGNSVWETHRQEEPYKSIPRIGTKAYITPLLVNVKGRDLIISNGSAIINAYDPLSGEEVWSIVRGAESTVAMPFEENGIVYFETGFMVDENRSRFSELMAVNPDGTGDISRTNVLWTRRIAPFPLSTPVIRDGLIYTVDANRTMRCFDAANGDEVWSHTLRSQFNSSPVYVNGKIYFNSTRGETLVLQAGREMKIIAENKLDGEIWATPAILRNSILMRTDTHLYRIGE
jgi:outer membrane protein assembly factor BamB